MIINGFEVKGSLPELKAPHAITILRPWIDAGSVGTMVLQRLESGYVVKDLAKLTKPGSYYDFTRYRPRTRYTDGVRELIIPNTTISYATCEGANDLVFINMLEPHMQGDVFAEKTWRFLKELGIRRYCMLGSFYDGVPHTRPILISGGSSEKRLQSDLEKLGINRSRYEGPTTICNLIAQQAEKAGVETLNFMVHLPNYVELEEDYMGMVALLKVLRSLYDIPLDESDIRKADSEMESIDAAVQQDKKSRGLIAQLERQYDARVFSRKSDREPKLSPEINNFLKEMENKFKDPGESAS
jgi:proteasome assembly chaperone (PAC2) family protein